MGSKTKKILSVVLSLAIMACFVPMLSSVKSNAAQYTSTDVPAEYASYISSLKASHPNWNFEFFYTGLDWNTVISNEDYQNRSLVSGSYPKSYRSTNPYGYNSATDTYTSFDAGGWYMAAGEVIAYYMDPRNFLNEQGVFQFEKLTYDSSTQTVDGVKSIIANSFMNNAYISNGTSNILYADAFMDAASYSGISPYFLASKVIQEVGNSGSGSTSGTYSGYEGIYNFYNIRASSGSTPIANGLKWASSTTAGTYLRPWNSQYKSIVGGAQYIGESFIYNGQNTIYLEKFDVETAHSGTYWHQYMQNISGAYTEGKKVYNAYSARGDLGSSFTFVIPVYNNMPSSNCNLPISSGSPYCYLSSLTVDNYAVTPSNTLQIATNNYYVSVPNSASSVTITATPFNSNARVTGLANSSSSGGNTGKVTNIDTQLRVRTSAGVSSPDSNTNRLTYNGNYVGLSNGTAVTVLSQQTVAGTVWYKIGFTYSGSSLTGWVSSDYIAIDASVVSNYGKVSLSVGDNVFYILVTGSNGETRTYVLTVTRSADGSSSGNNETQNGINPGYPLDTANKIISAVPHNTNVDSFKSNLGITGNTTVSVIGANGEVTSGIVGTGMTMRVTYSGYSADYIISVSGDANGDGFVSIFDIIKTRNQAIGADTASGAYLLAMDVNSDGKVDIFDIIRIRNMALE